MSGLIDFLIEHNRTQSLEYRAPGAALARQLYRARHPTAICALKCMDGRCNLPLITGVQAGIVQPWRNLGGRFDLGWPYFNRLMLDWVHHAVEAGRDCLVLVTYHFSRGDRHRGCRGFGYDVRAAIAATEALRCQFEVLFGRGTVYPILAGIETDEDALILHGAKGEHLHLAEAAETDVAVLREQVARLFPDLKPRVLSDLLPLVEGNVTHIRDVRAAGRPVQDLDHRERVLAVGRGFDWLHTPNLALIIGPYSPDLKEPIEVGARLLWDNVRSGRVDPSEGLVLMVSSPTQGEGGPDWEAARLKSHFLAGLAREVIRKSVPELEPHITPLVGVVNMQTREFARMEPRESAAAR